MMFFWMKKVETMVSKEKDTDSVQEERNFVVDSMTSRSENMLAPEEERVFPLEDE